MNIWFVNQFASTPEIPGNERSYQYAKAFEQFGHNVTLWTSSFSHLGKIETITDNSRFSLVKDGNLNLVSIKTKPLYYHNDYKRFLNMISFSNAIEQVSTRINKNPDVIISTYPSPFAAKASYKLSRKYGAKFICEIRDLWPQVWVERKAFSRYHPFVVILFALEKYIYKRTNFFVTALPFVNEYIKEKKIENRKIIWIPNGINIENFEKSKLKEPTPAVNKIISDMNSKRKKGVMNVIYIGSLGVGNRVDSILESFNILKKRKIGKIALYVIGEGHLKKNLKKYLKVNDLKNVKIFDAIPRWSVPKVLDCADVGILCLYDNPIYRYGVNLNKVYDYMAAKLPIIFSANVRNNMVEDSKGGITVPPGDTFAIAKAVETFKSIPAETCRAIGQKGYDHLIENYEVKTL